MALLCRAEHWPRPIRLHRLATTSANSLHLIDPGHGVRLTRVDDHNRAPSSTSLFCSPGRPKYTLRFVPIGSLRERFLKQRKSTSPIIRWSVRHGSDGLRSVKTFRERDWVQFFRQANENASVVCSSMVVVDAIDDRAVPILSGTWFYQTARVNAANLPMRTVVELKVS